MKNEMTLNGIGKRILTFVILPVIASLQGCEPNTPQGFLGCELISPSSTQKQVPVVFVPSGFGQNPEAFDTAVTNALTRIRRQKVYNSETPLAFYKVFPDETNPDFCDLGCEGIDRLLCCNVTTARRVAKKCEQSHTQVVVVHNDTTYGGGGYPNNDVGTITTHALAPDVAIHELGHSMFNLGDEYTYGFSTDGYPNCATAESGCEKWSDLIEAGLAGCELNACEGGNYAIGKSSVMKQLGLPFYGVNERLSCCFYAKTGAPLPSYCQPYSALPGGMGCGPAGGIASTPLRSGYWITLTAVEGTGPIVQWQLTESRFALDGETVRPIFIQGEGAGAIEVSLQEVDAQPRMLLFSDHDRVEVPSMSGEITSISLSERRSEIKFFVPHAPLPGVGEGDAPLPGDLILKVNGNPVR